MLITEHARAATTLAVLVHAAPTSPTHSASSGRKPLSTLSGQFTSGPGDDPTTGACRNTDVEIADICQVPGGMCTSWGGSPANGNITYRGSWVGDLVYVHEQPNPLSGGAPPNASKAMRFTHPGLAGLDDACASDVQGAGAGVLSGALPHLTLNAEVACAYTGALGGGGGWSAEKSGEGCAAEYLPQALSWAGAGGGGGGNVLALAFGVDTYGVRDRVEVAKPGGAAASSYLLYQVPSLPSPPTTPKDRGGATAREAKMTDVLELPSEI